MLKGLSLKKKGLMLLAVTLLLELALVSVLISMLRAADEEIGAQKHARSVISHLDHIADLRQSVTIGLTKLVSEPNSARFQQEYDAYISQVPDEFRSLREATKND